jgi:hypothetical protein
MTTSAAATLVPPLALPARSEDRRFASVSSGRPLPMAALIGSRVRSTVYGLAAVDARGRVADEVIMRALGWRAGRFRDDVAGVA